MNDYRDEPFSISPLGLLVVAAESLTEFKDAIPILNKHGINIAHRILPIHRRIGAYLNIPAAIVAAMPISRLEVIAKCHDGGTSISRKL